MGFRRMECVWSKICFLNYTFQTKIFTFFVTRFLFVSKMHVDWLIFDWYKKWLKNRFDNKKNDNGIKELNFLVMFNVNFQVGIQWIGHLINDL